MTSPMTIRVRRGGAPIFHIKVRSSDDLPFLFIAGENRLSRRLDKAVRFADAGIAADNVAVLQAKFPAWRFRIVGADGKAVYTDSTKGETP